MSTATASDPTLPLLGGRYHFLLRRLHSLTGIIFGGYLVVHLLIKSLPGTQDRMSGAEPVPLNEGPRFGETLLHLFRHIVTTRTDDHRDAGRTSVHEGREHMSDHGSVGDLMQHPNKLGVAGLADGRAFFRTWPL